MPHLGEGKRSSGFTAWILLALPVLAFYAILFGQWTAIPLADDYTALHQFALQWQALPSLPQRILALFTVQDGDYKLILDHLAVAAEMLLAGRIVLTPILLLGDLLPLAILFLLWKHTAQSETSLPRRLFLFAPVVFLVLQLNYAETVNWAMAGLQNLSVILFSLLSIHLLGKGSRSSGVAAFVSAIVACSALANGFLLLPVGVLMLAQRALKSALPQAESQTALKSVSALRAIAAAWKGLAAWCVGLLGALAVYLYGWHRPVRPSASPAALLHFYLSFLGGGLESMKHQPVPGLSVFVGAFLVVAFALLGWAGLPGRRPFLFWSTVWIFCTGVPVTLGRAMLGEQLALAGRYKIYCDLLLALLYLSVLELGSRLERTSPSHPERSVSPPSSFPLHLLSNPATRRYGWAGALLVSALLCSAADFHGNRFLRHRREWLQTHLKSYLDSGGQDTPIPDLTVNEHPGLDGIETYLRDLLTESLRKGVYRLPPR